MPYAYKINNLIKKSDDKEPSGTAGLPILNIIDKNNLNHTLIVEIVLTKLVSEIKFRYT